MLDKFQHEGFFKCFNVIRTEHTSFAAIISPVKTSGNGRIEPPAVVAAARGEGQTVVVTVAIALTVVALGGGGAAAVASVAVGSLISN